MKHEAHTHVWWAFGALLVLFAGACAYAFVRANEFSQQIAALSSDLASTTLALQAARDHLEGDLLALRADTVGISESLNTTKAEVAAANSNISGVQQAVGTISGAVNTLEKLTKTDPEILQKYSKVFFLSENYKPARLSKIPQEYVYSNAKEELFNADAIFFLQALLARAKQDNAGLFVKSAYRSFDEQQSVKAQHVTAYGAGTANAFSADQGYSEHQLGTTVDFVANGMNGQLTEAFDKTAAYQWLTQNAYRYGFVLSYPKGNNFYEYEPWHWRFVGTRLAQELRNRNINFYDLDQREIDAYLATIFDQ